MKDIRAVGSFENLGGQVVMYPPVEIGVNWGTLYVETGFYEDIS